jgi:hypothetical protein
MIRPLLTPMSDPTVDAIRRATLGVTAGVLFGAAIGLLNGAIWKWLRRPYRYHGLTGGRYRISGAEQEIRDEMNRRAGI